MYEIQVSGTLFYKNDRWYPRVRITQNGEFLTETEYDLPCQNLITALLYLEYLVNAERSRVQGIVNYITKEFPHEMVS